MPSLCNAPLSDSTADSRLCSLQALKDATDAAARQAADDAAATLETTKRDAAQAQEVYNRTCASACYEHTCVCMGAVVWSYKIDL